MDPISIAVEFEIGSFILGLAALTAAWLHHGNQKTSYEQKERHHRENLKASGHPEVAEHRHIITTPELP